MVTCNICKKEEGWINGICHKCEFKQHVTAILKRYIEANNALRNHPDSCLSIKCRTPDYLKLREDYRQAKRDLWEITDVEYDEDGFRNIIWKWRFAHVMARKCNWWLKSKIPNDISAALMSDANTAEEDFVKSCGLDQFYETTSKSIEKHFPNLCSKAPENFTTIEHGS